MKKWLLIPLSVVLAAALVVSGALVAVGSGSDVTLIETPSQTSAVTPSRFITKIVQVKMPSGKNLALNQKVSCNGITDVYTPERAVDGKTDTTSYWEGNATLPDTFTVTLSEPQTVGVVAIALNPDPVWQKRTQTFSIQVSADGKTFTQVVASKDYEFDPKTGNVVIIQLPTAQTVKAVQLNFTKNTGSSGAQMAELELFEKAD